MPTLTQVSQEHRERLMVHVERLPRLADEIGIVPWLDLVARVADEHAFLALLELRKTGEIALSQAAPFAPIRVSRADDERIFAWKTVRSA